MKIPDRIETRRLLLRKLNHMDAPALYENIRLKRVSRWLKVVPYPYPKNLALKFVLEAAAKFENGTGFNFGIEIKGKVKKVAGVISLDKVNYENKNAVLGYWLGEKNWGKGYMTEAVKAVLDFGFKRLKLHRIQAGVYSENLASKMVLEKTGFTLEGTEREKYFKEGRWGNYHTYGLLKREYK